MLLLIQAVGLGLAARRQQIRRPVWVGIGVLLPANLLPFIIALSGYRTDSEGKVHYTRSTQRMMIGIPMSIIAILLVLLTTNPDYMLQYFELPIGILVFVALVVCLFVLSVSVWLAFWRNMAKSGFGIALACTAIGWSTSLGLWLVLLGPAVVKLYEIFVEQG